MKPPKTEAGGTWTAARKWSFIRSALRRAFVRWPPNYQARKLYRRAYKGPNKLQKWEFQCALCRKWTMGKNTQLDHIVPAGSLRAYSDLPAFCERLFCEAQGLRVLCKKCHKEITQAQRKQNRP